MQHDQQQKTTKINKFYVNSSPTNSPNFKFKFSQIENRTNLSLFI